MFGKHIVGKDCEPVKLPSMVFSDLPHVGH